MTSCLETVELHHSIALVPSYIHIVEFPVVYIFFCEFDCQSTSFIVQNEVALFGCRGKSICCRSLGVVSYGWQGKYRGWD